MTASDDKPSAVPQGPVAAKLSFFQPPADGSKPWNFVQEPKEGPQRNFGAEEHEITIKDLRGRETGFTLDDNAFIALQNVQSAMNYPEWESDETIRRVYYPEVEKLLLAELPGANRIELFDYTIRRVRPGASRGPVTRVHIDQTPDSAAERVRLHAPDDAAELLRGRYRIVNVWRPLRGPVASFPLAVADSATVRDADLVAVEHRYPDRTGYTAGVRFHEAQQWYYWSAMNPDERLLLECFDSLKGGRVPHTAFVDPRSAEDAEGRESIEVRALVFG